MKAQQLIQSISPDLQQEILNHLFKEHKRAYQMVLNTLAANRKLRPVFLERKNKEDQFTFVLDQLRLRANEGVAEQVIQLWLLRAQQGLLKTFLDAVGIEHQDGQVETLPEEISDEKAQAGVDALLAEHPAEKAAVYLAMFQMQRPEGWVSLAKVIEAEPRLKLPASVAA
ncbi:MAG: hypothetical protein JWO94_3892 [Verrucomicrobiaceae bacterium]|nr:hypothetical protein [Verrucomicrobiaceae bacterium]